MILVVHTSRVFIEINLKFQSQIWKYNKTYYVYTAIIEINIIIIFTSLNILLNLGRSDK